MTILETIIGYDTSSSIHDLSVVCADCADYHGDGGGSALYEGEEWGGCAPSCSHCGETLLVTEVAS